MNKQELESELYNRRKRKCLEPIPDGLYINKEKNTATVYKNGRISSIHDLEDVTISSNDDATYKPKLNLCELYNSSRNE